MTRTFTRLVICLLIITVPARASEKPQQAAVATTHPAATVAGLETLAAGGNAFDAAVAVSAALAVVEPYGAGLGGGLFLLRQAGDEPVYRFLDARERAPQAARANMYLKNPEQSLNGALAAAIPGLPAALVELAQRFGRLPLIASLTPAIRLAEDGFPVGKVYRDQTGWRLQALRKNPESARIFLAQGEIPEQYNLIRQPQLAKTLKHLAITGHDGFYRGAMAEQLVLGVRAGGGIWSLGDLADYTVIERPPLLFGLDAQRLLVSAPPPSAGGVILAQSLGMLQQLPWQQADPAQRKHLVVEALRRAYSDSGRLGDPDYVNNPVQQLLGTSYLQLKTKGIDPLNAIPGSSLPFAPDWREGDNGTHFSLIDNEGNAVTATLSINLPFGAAFTVPGTGVLLNDAMDGFAAEPTDQNSPDSNANVANVLAPGKRPLSGMTPTFIESPDDFAAFGTAGGSRTPGMVLLAILQYLDQQPVATWVAALRLHQQHLANQLEHDPGDFSTPQLAQLAARGHHPEMPGRRYGNLQVLHWSKKDNQVEVASDPRGNGLAAIRAATSE